MDSESSNRSEMILQERIEEVTRTNEAFYKAFESLDVTAMDKIWAHQEYITCIHPGWSIRVGWPAVRDSWVVIFNNTFAMEFQLTELQVQVAAGRRLGDLHRKYCQSGRRDHPKQSSVGDEPL